jgi:hypothetical protein
MCTGLVWLRIGTSGLWSSIRVLGYRFRGPGSIPGATRFSEK